MPPLMLRCWFGRTCFFTIITCSTRSLASFENTRSTRPSFPESRPVITFTVSLRRMSTRLCSVVTAVPIVKLPCQRFQIPGTSRAKRRIRFARYATLAASLQHFRRQRHNLQKLLLAQFTRHRTKHARSHRLPRLVDQHRCILIKTDVGPIPPPMLFPGSYDHRLHHFAFLHLTVRRRFLHTRRDHVSKARAQPGRAAKRQDPLP